MLTVLQLTALPSFSDGGLYLGRQSTVCNVKHCYNRLLDVVHWLNIFVCKVVFADFHTFKKNPFISLKLGTFVTVDKVAWCGM